MNSAGGAIAMPRSPLQGQKVLISRDDVVGIPGYRTFQNAVVGRIGCDDVYGFGRCNAPRQLPEPEHNLRYLLLRTSEFRMAQHALDLPLDIIADIEATCAGFDQKEELARRPAEVQPEM